MTILDLLKLLFPNGTISIPAIDFELPDSIKFEYCPFWPTDVFAFCASLIDISGMIEPHPSLDISKIKECAAEWQSDITPSKNIQAMWTEVIAIKDKKIEKLQANDLKFVHFLLSIADETCINLSWPLSDNDNKFSVQSMLYRVSCEKYWNSSQTLSEPNHPFSRFLLPDPSRTLCHLANPSHVIVAPKSLCTVVGYTIRSLSHHLALISTKSQLNLNIVYASSKQENELAVLDNSFNILFIPFPFELDSNSIKKTETAGNELQTDKKFGHFQVTMNWLGLKNAISDAENLYKTIIQPLLISSRKNNNNVSIIALPECAIYYSMANELAKILYKKEYKNGVKFFITGAIAKRQGAKKDSNVSITYIFTHNEIVRTITAKHHRWKLDKAQVNKYDFLSFSDHNESEWWENIEIDKRKLPIYQLNNNYCFTTLICEDLARSEPAIPAIRAIGPNLIFALLMDGPQLRIRWPGRYATVLAEDPGSAVLTLTCAGMVDLANKKMAIEERIRSVALWKGSDGDPEEITLDEEAKGILLSIESSKNEQYSMDKRNSNGQNHKLNLKEWHQLYI